MSRVVHFEITANDLGKARDFYSKVFGWEFSKWEGPMEYWLIKTGEEGEMGINGGLMKRVDPSVRVVDTIDVSSVDECVEKIEAAGGRVTIPKKVIPGIGYLAYFEDTEGNVFGIMQPDISAQ